MYLSQILSYPNKPYIIWKAYLFSFLFIYLFIMTGFVVQGHMMSTRDFFQPFEQY